MKCTLCSLTFQCYFLCVNLVAMHCWYWLFPKNYVHVMFNNGKELFEYTFLGTCTLPCITVKFSGYLLCCHLCDIQFPFLQYYFNNECLWFEWLPVAIYCTYFILFTWLSFCLSVWLCHQNDFFFFYLYDLTCIQFY